MNMKRALLVATGCILLAIAACKKDKDEDKQETPVDLITSATWKIDTMGFDTNADGAIDVEMTPPLEPCDLDNTLTFLADSTGIFSEGATKCDDANPENIPFEWELKSNNSVINVSGLPSLLNGDVSILTLTSTSFVLSKTLAIPIPGYEGALIVSLKK